MNIKKTIAKFSLLAILLLVLGTSSNAQIYVSTTGNDVNDGTSANPKATIQAGINAASAGQTVYIAGGFYGETATLNKRVNLAYWSGTQAVSINGLTLDASDDYSSNSAHTNSTHRASIFATGADKLNALTSLTVTSGYYVLANPSNLQISASAGVVWNARDPQGGSVVRFTQSDNSTAQPLVALGSYNLTFSNSSTLSGNLATQLPASVNNLVLSNSGSLTVPDEATFNSIGGTLTVSGSGAVTLSGDVTVTKAITVNSGTGTVSIAATKTLKAVDNLVNNGRIDGPGTIEMSGAAVSSVNRSASGSGTFNADVLVQTNSQDLGSAVTLSGKLTVNGVTLDLKGYDLTLKGGLAYTGGGAAIETGTSAALVLSGDASQTIDLGDADRTVKDVTVNKGPASFLLIKPATGTSASADRSLIVSNNFNFQAGRIQLDQDNAHDGSLEFSKAATFRGILTRVSGSAASLTVNNTSTTSATTIAGNGQIYIPVTKTGAGEVVFSELTQTGDLTVSAGTLTFGQAVGTGTISVVAASTLKLNGGTSTTGAITNNGTLTFGAASTIGGAITNAAVGTTTIAAGSTTKDVTVNNASGAGTGSVVFKGGTVNGNITSDAAAGGTAAFSFESTSSGGLRNSVVTGNISLAGTGGTETVTVGGNDANNNQTVEVDGTIGAAALTLQNYAGLKVTKAFNVNMIAAGLNAAGVTLNLAGSTNYAFTIGAATTIENVEFSNTGRVDISSNNLTVGKVLKLTSGLVAASGGDKTIIISDNGKVYRIGGRVSTANEGGSTYDDVTLISDGTPSGITLYYQNTSAATTGGEFASNIYNTVRAEGAGKVTLASSLTPSVGAVVVSSGAELANNGNDITVTGGTSTPISVSGTISGTGDILYTAAGNESIAGSGTIPDITITTGAHTVTVSGALTMGAVTAVVAGTLNFNADATLGSLSASGAGTVNFGTSGPSKINGNLSISVATNINKTLKVGGSFTHTSGNITLGVGNYSLVIQGPSITLKAPNNFVFSGTGRFVLNDSVAQTLNLTSDVIINRVEINNPAGVTQGGGYIFYTQDLLLTNGVYNNGGFLNANGGLGRITVVNGSLQGAFTSGTEAKQVVYQNTKNISAGTELSGSVASLTVASADTASVTLTSPVTITSTLLAQSGTLAAGSNITMGSGTQLTVAAGQITGTPTFPSGSNTGVNIRYVNTADMVSGAELNATGKINNITLDATSGKKVTLSNNAVMYGDLTINSGTLDIGSDTLEIYGGVMAGTIASNGGILKFTGSSDETVDGSYTALPAITVAKTQNSSGVWGTLTITRTASSNAGITIGGNFNVLTGNAAVTKGNISSVTITGGFTVAAGARQFDGETGATSLTYNVAGDYSAAPAAKNTGESASATVPGMIDMGKFVFNGTANQMISHAQGGSSNPTVANYQFNDLEVKNSAGVTLASNVVVNGTATLTSGVITTGSNRLQVNGGTDASLVRTGGMINGTLRRAVAATTAGAYLFPMSNGTMLRQMTITTTTTTFSSASNVTVTANNTAPQGRIGLPIKDGSDVVDSLGNMSWVVTFSIASNAGNDPRFTLMAQGLTGFTNVQDLRMVSRPGDGEVANSWSLAGTPVTSLYSGGVPTIISDGVGGWSVVGTQEFSIAYPSNVTAFGVSGTVTYANDAATPDSGVVVTLNPGGMKDTTDANGQYSFANVQNGKYKITSWSGAAWLGANATDALVVSNYYNGTTSLSGVKLTAADVNNSGTVNNTDALLIVRRFAGLDSSFAAGNWAFTSDSITVSGSPVTYNVKSLAMGDVNASDVPGTAKLPVSVTLSQDGVVKVNQNTSFEVPVRISGNVSLGAISLKLKYQSAFVKFDGLSSKASGIVSNDNNGVISIAWANMAADKGVLNLKDGDALVTLRFTPTAQFKPGSKINIGIDAGASELAMADGSVLNGAALKVEDVESTVPTEFNLSQNYPNPFNPSTTIDYDLPVNGNVTLTVYNILGQQVATLINQVQKAGSYKIHFDASNLASGVYIYRMNVEAGTKSFSKTQRMMLLK